ncbi:uncharacterized protein K02A2.6-like [Eupeodes corollae]|uniref:uncharacterized protein K02A2.6-like n=1 Tax=Eupeodes corollae TaxID=290404 RepID=UPI00249070C3|nr:uncharacterized protein K02A2.6-like [Eupeodes corollae]
MAVAPNITLMTNITGPFNQFNEAEEEWENYIERFELFVTANNIKTDNKVSTLLACVGPKMYNLLKTLSSPETLVSKSYEAIVKLIREHLNPAPYFLSEQMKFSKRDQQVGESIAEYVVDLRKLATHCKFGTNLNEQLRDRFVSGIRNPDAKRKFRAEKEEELTFSKVIEIATGIELMERDAMRNTSSTSATVNFMKQDNMKRRGAGQQQHRQRQQQHTGSNLRRNQNNGKNFGSGDQHTNVQNEGKGDRYSACKCCGKMNHMYKDCKFKNYNCVVCGRKGHLKAVCYKEKRQNNFMDIAENKNENVQVIDKCMSLFTCEPVFSHKNVDPFSIELKIDGIPRCIQVDTGAGVSVISEKEYREKFSHRTLEKSNLVSISYTGEKIAPIGVIELQVEYRSVVFALKVFVVAGGSQMLVGREWLQKLNISLQDKTIFTCNAKGIEEMIGNSESFKGKLYEKFPSVFCDKLGTLKDSPVKIRVVDGTKPKYVPARSLPIALEEKVNVELDRLLREKILVKVETKGGGGTPIVPVLKSDGTVRICGDYRITINKHLIPENCSIPKIDDLMIGIKTGGSFTILDLSHAYQQMVLDNESKNLVTITTLQGDMTYNRVPYGIKVAPAIFQNKISSKLRQVKNVRVYFDEVLIFGDNVKEHYETLLKICELFDEMGLTVSKHKYQFFKDVISFWISVFPRKEFVLMKTRSRRL